MADRLLAGAPAPLRVPIADPKTGLLSQPWQDYFTRMSPTLDAIPSRLKSVSLDDQTGSLSATDFSNGLLLLGQYRLTYYVRMSSTSGGGSITVTFRWTDGGMARSFEGIPLSLGVATSGTLSETTLARVDKDSPITYETSFSGGTAYNLDVTLEKVALL